MDMQTVRQESRQRDISSVQSPRFGTRAWMSNKEFHNEHFRENHPKVVRFFKQLNFNNSKLSQEISWLDDRSRDHRYCSSHRVLLRVICIDITRFFL